MNENEQAGEQSGDQDGPVEIQLFTEYVYLRGSTLHQDCQSVKN